MSILCLNAGSSTLKTALFDDQAEREVASLVLPWAGGRNGMREALERALQSLAAKAPDAAASIRAVGHRVVHGGDHWREPVRIDAHVRAAIARFEEFAPLHNPSALQAIAAAQHQFPDLPHVAAFDTAFFADLPECAAVYPLPWQWHEGWGVRRYGFHGLSHAYASARAAELLRRDAAGLRVVVLHLGNGCSASAVRDGKPVATSMGFTPLEGLMMGTRSGSIDPGILVYVQRRHGVDVETLDRALNLESGLLGVSGVSSDVREVEAAADNGNERARLALQIYVERARGVVGALAVALGGVDALVFTAGVGEHAAGLRASICDGLGCLGLKLDAARNASAEPGADVDVAAADSRGRILVVKTREALMIARATRRVAAAEPAART
ncbi:MAG TPA: acetate/propionate family kinase [Candidatus Eisenbacteria bacterium]